MNVLRTFLILLTVSAFFWSCHTQKSAVKIHTSSDEVRIANDSLEYEIIIFEPGFEGWLATQPKQGFYSQSFLENKNRSFVNEYNYRVLHANRNQKSLYPQRIEYESNVDYGMEVNYLLYNYFLYFQKKYNQHFIGSRN